MKIVASFKRIGARAAKLVAGEFGRMVLVAPDDAPPMTSERIKAILEEED